MRISVFFQLKYQNEVIQLFCFYDDMLSKNGLPSGMTLPQNHNFVIAGLKSFDPI